MPFIRRILGSLDLSIVAVEARHPQLKNLTAIWATTPCIPETDTHKFTYAGEIIGLSFSHVATGNRAEHFQRVQICLAYNFYTTWQIAATSSSTHPPTFSFCFSLISLLLRPNFFHNAESPMCGIFLL